MRRHEVVVAILHLLGGLFVACCTAVVWIGAALLAPTFDGTLVPDLVAWVGRPIAITLLSIAAVDIVAAIALLRGPSSARRDDADDRRRAAVFVFPFGTALAIYTWWALAVVARRPARPRRRRDDDEAPCRLISRVACCR